MKYAVICPDGAADWPLPALGNRTPLEAARLPHLGRLALEGTVGRVLHVPPGMDNGSDICCMSLLGFDPARYHTGRAPLEAKSMGVALAGDDVAVRCNLVTVADGIMREFSAGHIPTEQSRELIQALEQHLGGAGLHWYAGVSYRHLLVIRQPGGLQAECTPPHNIIGQPVAAHLPRGPEAGLLLELMEKSKAILAAHPVNLRRKEANEPVASQIWLWGHGRRPTLPLFKEQYGLCGAIISAVDLMRSLGLYLGLEVLKVPNITGYTDTDYAAKGRYAAEALNTHDLVFVHVEAPDECGHNGDAEGKVTALERIDQDVLGPLLDTSAAKDGQLRVLVCPDHPTPVPLRTHQTEFCPFVAWGPGFQPTGLAWTEAQARQSAFVLERGHELMGRFLAGKL